MLYSLTLYTWTQLRTLQFQMWRRRGGGYLVTYLWKRPFIFKQCQINLGDVRTDCRTRQLHYLAIPEHLKKYVLNVVAEMLLQPSLILASTLWWNWMAYCKLLFTKAPTEKKIIRHQIRRTGRSFRKFIVGSIAFCSIVRNKISS